jgi:hypothetical protein
MRVHTYRRFCHVSAFLGTLICCQSADLCKRQPEVRFLRLLFARLNDGVGGFMMIGFTISVTEAGQHAAALWRILKMKPIATTIVAFHSRFEWYRRKRPHPALRRLGLSGIHKRSRSRETARNSQTKGLASTSVLHWLSTGSALFPALKSYVRTWRPERLADAPTRSDVDRDGRVTSGVITALCRTSSCCSRPSSLSGMTS